MAQFETTFVAFCGGDVTWGSKQKLTLISNQSITAAYWHGQDDLLQF